MTLCVSATLMNDKWGNDEDIRSPRRSGQTHARVHRLRRKVEWEFGAVIRLSTSISVCASMQVQCLWKLSDSLLAPCHIEREREIEWDSVMCSCRFPTLPTFPPSLVAPRLLHLASLLPDGELYIIYENKLRTLRQLTRMLSPHGQMLPLKRQNPLTDLWQLDDPWWRRTRRWSR